MDIFTYIQRRGNLVLKSNPLSHLAYTGTATGYCGDLYSQSGKIKDYILSSRSLFDNIHQGKHV